MNTWQLDQALSDMKKENPDLRVLGRVDDGIRSQARRIFTNHGQPSLKPSYCAAHTGMYIFDAFGDIYACWEKTGDSKIRIGHVDEAGEVSFNADHATMWRTGTVASNPVCMNCRYSLFCGGGGGVGAWRWAVLSELL